jgi:hypothetical protein
MQKKVINITDTLKNRNKILLNHQLSLPIKKTKPQQ